MLFLTILEVKITAIPTFVNNFCNKNIDFKSFKTTKYNVYLVIGWVYYLKLQPRNPAIIIKN